MENAPLVQTQVCRLTLEGARRVLEGARSRSVELGVPMDLAVCDDGGNLLAFERMDGARITSIEVAIGKAFTAAAARVPTAVYGESALPGRPAFGINVSNHGRFMIVPGGIPIFVNGQCVGGIGVSSGTPTQDSDVAQAGIDHFLRALATASS